MLIDLLIVRRTNAVCALAASSIGLVTFRKFWRRPKVVHQSELESVAGEPPINVMWLTTRLVALCKRQIQTFAWFGSDPEDWAP
jgi:hypothetical protein